MVHIKNRAIADFLIIVFMECRYLFSCAKLRNKFFSHVYYSFILTDKMKFGFMR